ncbi:MAG: CapA family protein [Saprospiraceae bacterium]|nr:CapA family protein [Saprospiraceae bacterium]MCF8248310.1 CapA family protein [Saprospiraceae bacterium]MCF8279936.1 CapA family protein [Bacteroidales bacterium]MCF8309838.1 CapA family protein [Saprospiraceae bacterium]MCF8438831.1 CapA family protein [Saprospiraceae bacterium]
MKKDSRIGGLFFATLFFLPCLSFGQGAMIVSIIGVGDMMLGTNYPSKNYLPANGGADLLAPMQKILNDADVTFGNLEGTLFDGDGTAKTCNDPAKCYVFRSPASYVQHFSNAGFDVLSIANNHSGDFGFAGRKGTKAVLKNAGIAFAGLEGTDETAVFERNGLKFGFCAFAPNSGTCDIRKIERAQEIVASLEKTCDIVIVSFHGGAEGADNQHVKKQTEKYLGENRGDVHKFAHAVIDVGADVVFGHGPHVTRAVELYKGRFISYSLGNFCTYGRFSLNGPAGISPIIKVFTDEEGQFQRGEIIPTYQEKSHGPRIDSQKRVIAKIKELTKTDFPNSGLDINSEGIITKR